MTALTGTEKQIAWAEEIRAAALPKAEAAFADWTAKLLADPKVPAAPKAHVLAALEAKITELRNRTAAKDWIEARNLSGDLQIYEAMRAAMKTAPKS